MTRTPTITRRRTIAGLTGLLTAGGAALALAPERTSAAIDISSLSVPDHAFGNETGTIYTPFLRATGSWEYVSEATEPERYRLALELGRDGADYEVLAETESVAWGFDDDGTYSLLGRVIDHSLWAPTDFDVQTDGGEIQRTLPVRVALELYAGEERLIRETAADTGMLTLSDDTVSIDSGVEGEVSWVIQESQADDTPTG